MDRIHHKPQNIIKAQHGEKEAKQSVTEAKQQLRIASSNIDYLAPIINPIKQHPIKSVAGAFAVGVALNSITKKGLPPSLLSLLITAVSKL